MSGTGQIAGMIAALEASGGAGRGGSAASEDRRVPRGDEASASTGHDETPARDPALESAASLEQGVAAWERQAPGTATAIINAMTNPDTGLTDYESREIARLVSAWKRGGAHLGPETFHKVAKALKAPDLRALVFNRSLGMDVGMELANVRPPGIVSQACGAFTTTTDCARAIVTLGGGGGAEGAIHTGIRRMDDINTSGVPLAPHGGDTPLQDHFAAVSGMVRHAPLYQKLFLFASSLTAASGEQQDKRLGGTHPRPIDAREIAPYIRNWGFKIEIGATLGPTQDPILESIRAIVEGEHNQKRQKTNDTGSPGASARQSPAAPPGAGASPASYLPAGTIIKHCYDFQRPNGCSRAGCHRDHVLIRCRFHPKCENDAQMCHYHHG